jgi:hypothetical protein
MSAIGQLWERSGLWRWLSSAAVICIALIVYLESVPAYRPATGNGASFTPSVTSAPDAVAAHGQSAGQPPAVSAQTAAGNTPAVPAAPQTAGAATPGKNQTIVPVAPDPSMQSAAPNSLMGKPFADSIPFAGFNIPLPKGIWTVVAFQRGGVQTPANEVVILARIDGKQLGGLIAINAYQDPQKRGAGFPQTNFCSRPDYVYREAVSNEAFGHQECWWINHASKMWTENTGVMKAAHAELALRAVNPPDTMVNVGFRFAEANKFMTLFVYFNPEEEGINTPSSTWGASEWHRDRIYQYPEKTAYVKKLTAWGKTWVQGVHAAL